MLGRPQGASEGTIARFLGDLQAVSKGRVRRDRTLTGRLVSTFHAANREGAKAYSVGFEDYRASLAKRLLDRMQVGKKECQLAFGAPLRTVTKENEGRLGRVAQREQSAEVGISGYEHAVFIGGTGEDVFISRGLQVIIADMDGVVPGASEAFGHDR